MKHLIRGLMLMGLLVVVTNSTARAQNTSDKVTVHNSADGTTKTHDGLFKVSAAGFQVVSGDKVIATVNPDDVVKVAIGDLQGVDRSILRTAVQKEGERDFATARATCEDLIKKPGLDDRSKRYLEFKRILLENRIVDHLSGDQGWTEKADKCLTEWNAFLVKNQDGWELWAATRACTRLQIERGKFDDAARHWNRISKNANMPPDAKLEAALQEIDLQIRSKTAYSSAANSAGELLKTAVGAKKDRLTIYQLAASDAGNNKPLEGIEKIKAVMDKTKDPSVHATGFSMIGELYLAGGKTRDAMWMFLWVETVMNQDKDEALKAMLRLVGLFETQMDEDQVKKYRDKIKQFRDTFLE